MKRKELGALGEKLAVNFLKRQGYRIMQTNFRCRQGEIDIVAKKDGWLVFVEVRTRKGGGFGTPEESITLAKKEKLISLASIYLQTHDRLPASWRIDVVVVELDESEKVKRLELIENAITG